MRNLLYRVFLFFIPVIIFIIGCEIFVRTRPNLYIQKKEQLAANADSVEILILGSSHAMDGVDPNQFFLYAYNFAFAGQSIHFDLKMTEKYLPVLPRLKYVILMLDYNSLYFDHDDGRDFFYKYYFDISYKNNKFYKESLLQSFFVYKLENTLSMMYSSIKDNRKEPLVKGWVNNAVRNDEFVSSVERNEFRAKGYNVGAKNWEGGDSVINDLEELINLFLSKNVVPLLITYPNYSLMNSFMDVSSVERTRSVGYEFSQKYQIPYLDFNEDNSFTIEYFFNCDHLNKRGAAKLSGKINEVIMNMEEKRINIEKNIVPLSPENP